MKKKGFTLIELLATIVILGLIGLIVYPTMNKVITENREKLYNQQVEELKRVAENWTVSNNKLAPTENNQSYYLQLDELYNSGLIQQSVVYNPNSNEKMTGCIRITWKESIKQYTYTYDEVCRHVDSPNISFSNDGTTPNENGWLNDNFYINVGDSTLDEYTYCVSNEGECTPNNTVNGSTGSIYITTEGSNYVCIKGKNVLDETEVVCKEYKLDKTGPVFGGISDITVNKGDTVDLGQGITAEDTLSGMSGTYTYNPTTVDTSKAGTTNVTYTATDLAGNTTTVIRKVIVDADGPSIDYAVNTGIINSNG